MSNLWFFKGVKKGIKTEKFPEAGGEEPPLWPSEISGSGEANCPTNAITDGKWISGKCIFCRRCLPNYRPNGNQAIYQVSEHYPVFKDSFHIFAVDVGSCGACNMEFLGIFSPQYDANRLGIFMTNTPRHADAIIVMGVLTEDMKTSLEMAYEAMPEPKLIIALGACAISGGIIGSQPLQDDRYNVVISGCPPSPYTILNAILSVKNRTDEAESFPGDETA